MSAGSQNRRSKRNGFVRPAARSGPMSSIEQSNHGRRAKSAPGKGLSGARNAESAEGKGLSGARNAESAKGRKSQGQKKKRRLTSRTALSLGLGALATAGRRSTVHALVARA
jgi:hypothetical protein